MLKRIIDWLDGRKTVLGSLLAVLYVGAVAQGVVQRDDTIEWIITGVLGVGLADKVRKG